MSKLKENIDRILGNSIRCLLPSYWWKRLFGMVVDEVENETDKIKNSISTLKDGYKALEESKADADAFIMLETTELDRMEYGAVYLVRGLQDSLKVNFWEYKSPRPDVLNWTIWFSNKTSLEVTSNGVAFQWEGGTPTIDLSNLNPNSLYRLDCTLVTVGASGTTVKYVKRVARIVEYGASDKYDTFVSETSTNAVQNKVIKKYVDGKLAEIPVVTVDSELSDTSENPVQNKAVTAALNEKQDKCINFIDVGICNTFDELYDKLKDEQISLTTFLTGNIGGRIIVKDQHALMHVTDSYILIHTESASFASYRETQTIAVYDKNSNVYIGDKEHPVYSNWKEINVAALGSYVENSFPSFRVCYMINVENQSQLERKYSIHYPLSIERFPNSHVGFPEYYECVVYVNNTFERWRIYADGDIEKIS